MYFIGEIIIPIKFCNKTVYIFQKKVEILKKNFISILFDMINVSSVYVMNTYAKLKFTFLNS